MDDLEIVRRCAEKMGITEMPEVTATMTYSGEGAIWADGGVYRPLTNDAQAMALVKKFEFGIAQPDANGCWAAFWADDDCGFSDKNLNRAICECVANMP